MTEQEFSDRLLQEAREALDESKYVVKAKYNLFYELCLNDKGELLQELDEPTRGSSAFQADIVVFEKESLAYPRIVFELKTEISTHDIITYSEKAGRHKLIYPGLRYGMIACNLESIPARVFIHNENLDFVISAKQIIETNKLGSMIKRLVEEEMEASKISEALFDNNHGFCWFRSEIIVKKTNDVIL